MALALAALLRPASLMLFALGLWRMAADMRMTGDFPIHDGIFSHWQVWMVMGIATEFCVYLLNRYGMTGAQREI